MYIYVFSIVKPIYMVTAVSTGNPEQLCGFLKLFVVTETGKELNFPKGGKGF
jgi:hypothetical protein